LQLTDEGVAQLFTQFGGNKKIIGCVGELQFEVIQYRLLHEYGASVQFNSLPYFKACWITSNDPKKLEEFTRFKHANIAEDKDGHLVYLAQSEWFLNTERNNNPDIEFNFTTSLKGPHFIQLQIIGHDNMGPCLQRCARHPGASRRDLIDTLQGRTSVSKYILSLAA
jgi:hypothetical protein